MVTRSELVQSAGRGKFSVGSLPELEQALIAKLSLSVESVAIEVWDKASGSFAQAGELGELPDRCKLRLHGAHTLRLPLAGAQMCLTRLARLLRCRVRMLRHGPVWGSRWPAAAATTLAARRYVGSVCEAETGPGL